MNAVRAPQSPTSESSARTLFPPVDTFAQRHLGPDPDDLQAMLKLLDRGSLEELADAVVPADIRLNKPLNIGRSGPARGEHELLGELRAIADTNQVFRSCLGMGYYGTITPPVIQRNILENPGWYTQYTPYQAEISQGRLEVLLNFQTMVADLTGLPLSNSSLLDEATAAAEAMTMAMRINRSPRSGFFVADNCHPQTLSVIRTRAEPIGVKVHVGDPQTLDIEAMDLFGALVQYPGSDGRIEDFEPLAEKLHAGGAQLIVATDLLALSLLKSPGSFGADIAVGSAQRFGVPMGYGGPHAGFLAASADHARRMPGRLVGVSKDAAGRPAYRLAIQTREQHIKRDRATSNICTAQVLLAIMAATYAVYHGPKGLRQIAERVRAMTASLADGLRALGHQTGDGPRFDTLRVSLADGLSADDAFAAAAERRINLRRFEDGTLGISLDETADEALLEDLLAAFTPPGSNTPALAVPLEAPHAGELERSDDYLQHPVFRSHHGEHAMLRYLHRLQAKDLSLTTSMIPLGSCTMKLNATSEMLR